MAMRALCEIFEIVIFPLLSSTHYSLAHQKSSARQPDRSLINRLNKDRVIPIQYHAMEEAYVLQ